MSFCNNNKVMNEETNFEHEVEMGGALNAKPGESGSQQDSINTSETLQIKSTYVKFLEAYPRSILLFFLLISIGIGFYGFGVFGDLSGGGFTDPNSESVTSQHYFNRFDNISASSDLLILFDHPTWTVDSENYRAAYFQIKNDLAASYPLSKMRSFFDYPDESGGLVSNDRHMALFIASLPEYIVDYQNKPIITAADLEGHVGDNPLTITFGGGMLSSEEVNF